MAGAVELHFTTDRATYDDNTGKYTFTHPMGQEFDELALVSFSALNGYYNVRQHNFSNSAGYDSSWPVYELLITPSVGAPLYLRPGLNTNGAISYPEIVAGFAALFAASPAPYNTCIISWDTTQSRIITTLINGVITWTVTIAPGQDAVGVAKNIAFWGWPHATTTIAIGAGGTMNLQPVSVPTPDIALVLEDEQGVLGSRFTNDISRRYSFYVPFSSPRFEIVAYTRSDATTPDSNTILVGPRMMRQLNAYLLDLDTGSIFRNLNFGFKFVLRLNLTGGKN
jgi:hypothetical protein